MSVCAPADTRVARDETTARAQLKTMLLGAVKARSTARETYLDGELQLDAWLNGLNPWLFGPRSVVEPLQKRLANPSPVTPLEYRNWMFIALRSEPAIAVSSVNLGSAPLPFLEELEHLPAGNHWPAS